jgi:hypothetical protein
VEQLKELGRAVLSWVVARRVALALVLLGAVGFYVEKSPLKDTAEGQTVLYLVVKLISLVGLG